MGENYQQAPQRGVNRGENMTQTEWENFWIKFDAQSDKIDDKFQKEMVKKHGKGYYYIDPDDHWARQQKIIRKLVEALLKEKNNA